MAPARRVPWSCVGGRPGCGVLACLRAGDGAAPFGRYVYWFGCFGLGGAGGASDVSDVSSTNHSGSSPSSSFFFFGRFSSTSAVSSSRRLLRG